LQNGFEYREPPFIEINSEVDGRKDKVERVRPMACSILLWRWLPIFIGVLRSLSAPII